MKLLFLTHRLPYAPNRGDRIRSYHLLRALAARHEVRLVSLVHDAEEQRHVSDLNGMLAGVEVRHVRRWRNLARVPTKLPSPAPLTHVLLDADLKPLLQTHVSRHRPDLVVAYCSGMASLALEPPLSDIPFVLDMVDVDSEKWRTLGACTRGPRGWVYRREAERLARFETDATRKAFATTIVNERERQSLSDLAPGADIRIVANGIDTAAFRPPGPQAGEPRVVFTGVFNYQPNEEAAVWLAERVWPLVRRSQPQARLTLVGANPTARVQRLTRVDASIEVTGTVPQVQPYLWQAAVAAAPLATARGVQNKVLEAIAAGLPAVVTPVVYAGLPAVAAPACIVASDPTEFSAAILQLLGLTADERRARAERADLSSLSWPAQLAPFLELILEAGASPATTETPRPRQ
ncbi:MAG: TIGR03087 family PEP-CTERM/XrtA system glycosyltransferase [Acidobacteriota bacterium]|nr:TIGR03087 family PEP-CTERM/XrtA system glycosyltransferase [Acidobacteriota bacterium]